MRERGKEGEREGRREGGREGGRGCGSILIPRTDKQVFVEISRSVWFVVCTSVTAHTVTNNEGISCTDFVIICQKANS